MNTNCSRRCAIQSSGDPRIGMRFNSDRSYLFRPGRPRSRYISQTLSPCSCRSKRASVHAMPRSRSAGPSSIVDLRSSSFCFRAGGQGSQHHHSANKPRSKGVLCLRFTGVRSTPNHQKHRRAQDARSLAHFFRTPLPLAGLGSHLHKNFASALRSGWRSAPFGQV
jgi:hypothetical protein